MRMANLLKAFIAAVVLLVLQTGCAPQTYPTSSPNGQGNLTLEVRRLHGALSDQERSLQQLSREVAELDARLELQQKDIEDLRRQAATAPSARPGPASTMAAPGEASTATEADGIAQQMKGTPTDIYLRAFGDYANARYTDAVLGFELFLRNFPNNGYASNAQYWLADSHFKQQQLAVAIDEFDKLLQFYPEAAKAPDALLKIATAHALMGNPDQARETLERLKRRYPESAAAQKAEELVLP